MIGEAVPIEYIRAHTWLYKNYVKNGTCEQCGTTTKTEWSNKSGEYRMEREDWQEFCAKCHRRYDKQPHMRGASIKHGLFQISNPESAAVRKFRLYMVRHDLTKAELFEQLVATLPPLAE